jgi:hypothetical protein
VSGLSIGALEDYHKVAEPTFFKWTGREPSDSDIRELVNGGVRTGEDIEKYITNRPDVVAAHPGAPIRLSDIEYSRHKSAIDSSYLANTGRVATHDEARTAYSQAASPFRKAPAEQVGLSSGVKLGQAATPGNLMSEAQVAPNARSAGGGYTGL